MGSIAYTMSSKRSRVEQAPKVVQFTTVKATKDAIIREDGRSIRAKLSPGDVSSPISVNAEILTNVASCCSWRVWTFRHKRQNNHPWSHSGTRSHHSPNMCPFVTFAASHQISRIIHGRGCHQIITAVDWITRFKEALAAVH